MTGTIKKIPTDRMTNKRQGFFFICPDEGHADVFGHIYHALDFTMDSLEVGDRVSFELGVGKDGRQRAENIRTL